MPDSHSSGANTPAQPQPQATSPDSLKGLLAGLLGDPCFFKRATEESQLYKEIMGGGLGQEKKEKLVELLEDLGVVSRSSAPSD